MPLYEYRCQDCRRRVTVLVRTPSQTTQPVCNYCGGSNLSHLISKFSFHRSVGSSLDLAPDSEALEDMDTEDPKAMASWLHHMKQEMGDEVTPEFENMIDELESGGTLSDEDYDEETDDEP